MPQGVLAVVPTFRPGPDVLAMITQLRVALPADAHIVVSDDASPCSFDNELRALGLLPNTEVVRHTRNAGIARGLNDGLQRAIRRQASWLLTVDQDSRVTKAHLHALLDGATRLRGAGEPLGVVAPGVIDDASGPLRLPGRPRTDGLEETSEVMQSGALWSVSALSAVGGFDEGLGMDGVDAGACLSLRESGFLVLIDPAVQVIHQLGDPARSRTVRLLGRATTYTAHGPARRRSMIRARMHLFPREWKQSPGHALRTLRRVAVGAGLAVVFTPDRWAHVVATMRGVHEGLRR